MRTHTRTTLGALVLALLTAAGGCGSGGPGAYLVEAPDSGERPAPASLLPGPAH